MRPGRTETSRPEAGIHGYFLGLCLVAVIGVSGCTPSARNEDSPETDLGVSRQSLVVREDVDDTRILIPSERRVGINFSEALTGVSIDVVNRTRNDCPAEYIVCEDWRFSAPSAIEGSYRVALGYSRGFGSELLFSGPQIVLHAVPKRQGSAAIRKIASNGVHLALTVDGRVWSWGSRGGPYGLGTWPIENAFPTFPREITAPGFSDITDIAVSPQIALALQDDGTVWEWRSHTNPPPGTALTRYSYPYVVGGLDAVIQQTVALANPATRIVAIAVASDNSIDAVRDGLATMSGRGDARMVLLDNGMVATWGTPTPRLPLLSDTPTLVPGLTDVVAISALQGRYFTALRSDGRVVEWGLVATPALFGEDFDGTYITEPTEIAGLDNVVAISGRRALLADGTVRQWLLSETPISASQPVAIEGLSNVTSLPDPSQNLAILDDNSIATWAFGRIANPRPARPGVNLGLEDFRSLSGNLLVDNRCGRTWRIRRQDLVIRGLGSPVHQLGDRQDCADPAEESLILFYVTGTGSGTVQSDAGPVNCESAAFGRYCWILGTWTEPPVFTAVPGRGSEFDRWLWDCESASPTSRPVMTRPANGVNSQNECKVVFNSTSAEESERLNLSVLVFGGGTVTSSPAGINCGTDCSEAFDTGTTVVLTAIADDGHQFSGWAGDSECLANPASTSLTIVLNENVLCFADFAPAEPPNLIPPIAQFTYAPTAAIGAGTTVTFDGSASSDADGTVVSWEWDFDGDGLIDAMGPTATFAYGTAGTYSSQLAVADNDGQVATSTQSIVVSPPTSTVSLRVLLSGPGSVVVQPNNITLPNATDCDGNECFVFNVPTGSVLTAEAAAFTPAAFLGWSATECDSVSPASTCTVTMNTDRSVTATFQ